MRGCLFSCVFKKWLISILSENVRNLELQFMKADNHAGLRALFCPKDVLELKFSDKFSDKISPSRTNSRTK